MVVASVTAGMLAADNAGDCFGTLIVGDHRHRRHRAVGLAVEGQNFLAVPGEAGVDIAFHLAGVEDVERSGIGEGDVVGDVDQR